MNYRELKEGEVIIDGDRFRKNGTWKNVTSEFGLGREYNPLHYKMRRPLPEVTRPTKEEFDASCNDEPSIRVSNEELLATSLKLLTPHDEFDISQHSADEVIHPKADDLPMPICWRIGDECVINQDRYIIRSVREVYTVDAIGDKYSFDTSYGSMARPERNARQVAIAEALEVFTGMISPSENQLGVLYDAGYLLPKKDD